MELQSITNNKNFDFDALEEKNVSFANKPLYTICVILGYF